jgi:hypothetical protein
MAGDLRSCPRCSGVYPADVVVCVRCGIDLRTGQPLPTPQYDPEGSDEAPPPWWRLGPAYFAACFPGLLRPTVLVGALLAGIVGVIVMLFGLMLILAFMVVLSGSFVAAAGLVLWAQGAAWIVQGEYGILHDQLADFDSVQWNLFLLLVAAPIVLLIVLMVLAAESAPR